MNLRTLGRTGLRVSALGFGCMRLPMDGPKVDDRRAIPLLRRAVELGVTYFDTAVGYCQGDSQRALGDALHDLRGRIVLSTKNPEKDPSEADAWWKNLETSLRLLRTDHVDVYHSHGLSWAAFTKGLQGKGGLLEAWLKAREQGLIRHIAFSSHDAAQNIMKLADEGVFESVTLQYNLLNREHEPAIAYLKEKNMGVVVMGPVGGGRLANQTLEGQAGGATSAELALKFVLSNPGVTVALSGMSDMAMLEENVGVASRALSLSKDEEAEVGRASAAQVKLLDYYCTACGYCMPCPSGVDIPENFTLAQMDQAYGMTELARQRYVQTRGRARFCLACGTCLDKCPQSLTIPDHMKRVVERLDPDVGRSAVELEVAAAAQSEGGLRLDLEARPFNLTDQSLRGELRVEVAGAEVLRRGVLLKPRTHRKIKAHVEVRPETTPGEIPYQAVFEGGGAEPSVRGVYKALFARRVRKGQPVKPDQALIHGPAHVAIGQKSLTAAHRTRFRVAHDGTNLILAAKVDEDLLGPAAGDEEKQADCLVLFLDCRPEGEMRQGRYAQGCARLELIPALKGGQPRIVEARARGLDFSGAALKSRAREGGYALEARIPLSGLNLAEGQRVLGFDLAQFSADAEGKTDLALVWAAGRSGMRGTSGFGLVRLEGR